MNKNLPKFKINLLLKWIPFLNCYNHVIELIDIKIIFKNENSKILNGLCFIFYFLFFEKLFYLFKDEMNFRIELNLNLIDYNKILMIDENVS